MKVCLNCQELYENKREASKFCSTSCRVMYNRKHPKPKETITVGQMQNIYNSILEVVGKINQRNELPQPVAAAIQAAPFQANKPVPQVVVQAVMRSYWAEKLDLTPDDYPDWLKRLYADPRLSSKQKDLIKNTNQHE